MLLLLLVSFFFYFSYFSPFQICNCKYHRRVTTFKRFAIFYLVVFISIFFFFHHSTHRTAANGFSCFDKQFLVFLIRLEITAIATFELKINEEKNYLKKKVFFYLPRSFSSGYQIHNNFDELFDRTNRKCFKINSN